MPQRFPSFTYRCPVIALSYEVVNVQLVLFLVTLISPPERVNISVNAILYNEKSRIVRPILLDATPLNSMAEHTLRNWDDALLSTPLLIVPIHYGHRYQAL